LWVVFANVAQHHLVHVYKYLLITPGPSSEIWGPRAKSKLGP
jgi:hypothetical protein